uniref:Uncharacterized protein n=1 Tax=Meloidogyne javanica TaxID=6303 RepID=A0A915N7S2_MELJA
NRQLVHCWELAGGGSMTNLLEIPFFQPSRIASILLFVDLTVPEQFQQITDPIMTFCRKQVDKWMITDIEPQQIKEESKIIKPLGIPLVLVCARYDDFQNFESERKRLTYRSIRQFAYINGASIIVILCLPTYFFYFLARMDSLMQRALLLLSNAVSDAPFPKTFATDPQQPLFVLPYGIDSEKIDPSEESLINSTSSYSEAIFNYIQSLNSAFPQLQQQIDDAGGGEGDRRQQFDEPKIDAFVEERIRKLELHVRELQDRLQTEKKLENLLNNINQQTLEQFNQRQQNSPQQNSWQFPNFQQKQQNYNQQQPYYLNNQKGLIRLPNNNAESNEKGEAIVTEIKPSASFTHMSGQHSFLVDSREILIPPPPPPLQPWRRLKNITQNEEEENEEENIEPFEQQQQNLLLNGPCLTANCKTWITITIPSELVGIPSGIGSNNGGGGKKEENGNGRHRLIVPPKPLPTIESKPLMPPFPPKPMPKPLPHRSRGSPSPKNRPKGATTTTVNSNLSSATTKAYPPDFVFSTKWILPVDGRTKSNNESNTDSNNTGGTIISSTQPTSIRGIESLIHDRILSLNFCFRPFTIRPKSSNALIPKERPSAKKPANSIPSKPWTHSSASSNHAKARPPSEKQAPHPQTPDTTIEQAAIWASTELIDAIREALAKFRATLKHDEQLSHHHPHISKNEEFDNPEEAERELNAQLQSALEILRGTWLEHTVEDLAQQTDALGLNNTQIISPLAYLPPHVQYKVFTYLSRKDLDNCKQILPYWEWIINFGDGTLCKYSRKERKEMRKWKLLANLFFASRICGDLTAFLFLLVAYHLPFILNYIIISLWVLEYISVSIVTKELLDGNSEMIKKYMLALIDNENYDELVFGYLFYWFNMNVSIIVNFIIIFYAINYVPTIVLLSIYSGLLIASFVLSSREVSNVV